LEPPPGSATNFARNLEREFVESIVKRVGMDVEVVRT